MPTRHCHMFESRHLGPARGTYRQTIYTGTHTHTPNYSNPNFSIPRAFFIFSTSLFSFPGDRCFSSFFLFGRFLPNIPDSRNQSLPYFHTATTFDILPFEFLDHSRSQPLAPYTLSPNDRASNSQHLNPFWTRNIRNKIHHSNLSLFVTNLPFLSIHLPTKRPPIKSVFFSHFFLTLTPVHTLYPTLHTPWETLDDRSHRCVDYANVKHRSVAHKRPEGAPLSNVSVRIVFFFSIFIEITKNHTIRSIPCKNTVNTFEKLPTFAIFENKTVLKFFFFHPHILSTLKIWIWIEYTTFRWRTKFRLQKGSKVMQSSNQYFLKPENQKIHPDRSKKMLKRKVICRSGVSTIIVKSNEMKRQRNKCEIFRNACYLLVYSIFFIKLFTVPKQT